MIVCKDYRNHLVLVTRYINKEITYISLDAGTRKHRTTTFREFGKTYELTQESPFKLAKVWLNSTIPITERARKELNMIVALQKNKVVARYEEEPANKIGVKLIAGVDDLTCMKLEKIIAIHNANGEKQIEGGEIADVAAVTWALIQDVEIVPKEKKERAPRAKKESAEPRVTARSQIREFIKDKDSFTIADIVGLVGGSNSNASTTITLLIKPEKAGKEGPIPFVYDKANKVYTKVTA